MNRVGVHRVKNPSRMRYVQAVVNQKPNVYVNQKRKIKGSVAIRGEPKGEASSLRQAQGRLADDG